MSAQCKLSGILVPVAVIVLFYSAPSLSRDHYLPDHKIGAHDVISKNQTLAYLEHSPLAAATDDNSFTGGLQGLEITPKLKQSSKIPYFRKKIAEKSHLHLNLGLEGQYIGHEALLETVCT